MRLFMIGAGIFFLVNPILGVSDILPDFIGCFLIMSGIRDAAYMIEKLHSARRWFMYGACLSIIRFAVSFMGVERQHTLPLTLAFCFAIVELIIYIPAFKFLFDGFDYAAMRHGNSGVLSVGKKMDFYTDESGKRQYGLVDDDTTGRLAALSQRFIAIRAAASLLPELPALQLSESQNAGSVTGFKFVTVTNLIRFVTVLIVLVPAVVLFIKYVKFLRRIRKSEDFIPSVNEEIGRRFEAIHELHASSNMKLVSFVWGIAMVLYMGFYDYQINIVPRYFSAAALCLAAVLLFIGAGKGRRITSFIPVLFAAGTVPLSIKTYALQYEHYRIYKIQMLRLFESGNEYFYARDINEMNEEYLQMAVAESLEAIVLGLGLVLFAVLYMRTVLSHAVSFKTVSERLREDIVKSLKIRGGLMIGAVSLSAAYFTAYRFILPYFDSAPMAGIGLNVLAVVMIVNFALQACRYVYGNLYGFD